jgi:hypothetical protein
VTTVGTDTIRRSVDVPVRPAGTEVEVRFSGTDNGTHVELEHRGWRDAAPELIEGYGGGWEHVLRAFAARAS